MIDIIVSLYIYNIETIGFYMSAPDFNTHVYNHVCIIILVAICVANNFPHADDNSVAYITEYTYCPCG